MDLDRIARRLVVRGEWPVGSEPDWAKVWEAGVLPSDFNVSIRDTYDKAAERIKGELLRVSFLTLMAHPEIMRAIVVALQMYPGPNSVAPLYTVAERKCVSEAFIRGRGVARAEDRRTHELLSHGVRRLIDMFSVVIHPPEPDNDPDLTLWDHVRTLEPTP